MNSLEGYFGQARKMSAGVKEFESLCQRLGAFGNRFLAAFDATGTVRRYDSSSEFQGAFEGYDSKTFQNAILINKRLLENQREFFGTLFHESIHAIQAMICAPSHATFANRHSPVVLSPYSNIVYRLFIERDAHAKEFFFQYAAEEIQKTEPEEIIELINDIPRVQETIQNISRSILSNHAQNWDIKKFYIDHHLNRDYYVETFENRKDVVFVRLDKKDLWDSCNSLEINSLCNDCEDVRYPPVVPMRDYQWENLNSLNAILGIRKDNPLPTLEEALGLNGLDRKQFLEISRASR